MKNNLKFLSILVWESIENAPMLIGFLLAVRLQAQNLTGSLTILVIGTASGAILIHFTESKKYSNQPTRRETLVNFGIFTVVAIPFVFYLSANGAWWSTWIIDIILGITAGFVLSFGESWGWNSTTSVKAHSISMAVAFAIFLSGIRFTSQLEPMIAIFMVGIVLNLFVSGIIVLLEYWPIKESHQMSGLISESPITKKIKL